MKIVNRKIFYKQLFFITSIAILFIISWSYVPQIVNFQLLGIQSLFIFVGFSIYVFEKGLKVVQQTDKNAFIRFVFSNIMIKMFLSVGIVFFYYKNYHPGSKFFLIPFFVNYLLFMIFEIMFSSKIGKIDSPTKIRNDAK